MTDWSERPAKQARADVARWFATLPTGAVFLDGEGRAVPLAADAARTLRASAEQAAATAAERLWWRGVAVLIGVAIVVITGQSLANALRPPFAGAVHGLTYALYVAHAVWAIAEAVRYQRILRRLRRAIAHDLRGHVPLPAAMEGTVTAGDAVFGVIAAVLFGIAALTVLAEVSAYQGVDIVRFIPGWVPLAAVGSIYALVFVGKHIDRRRGVGVLPAAPRPFDRYRRDHPRR